MRSKPVKYDIALLQAHDEGEWARLNADYFDRVYFYIKRRINDADIAEDACLETFFGALKGISRFDERYNIEQYLFGIAAKKVVDVLRKSGHEIQIVDDDEDSTNFFGNVPGESMDPAVATIQREKINRQRDALVEILKDYTATLWEAGDFKRLKTIELIFLKGWKHRRIAEYLDYPDEKAVAGVKFRAIRDFQERLK
ncbi:MAG: sigma-70 family RNA polymerase sigma factor, partial [Pirellulaceae bacterium]|nr:sigma-70 family RNA polymerase sigma factor [Pirellulaceae bacterium]